jgi:glutathione S-transferase
MKLSYSPGACSLAGHIALAEAGLAYELDRVDLKTKTTADGADFRQVNAKGYVPALVIGSGETLTGNIAILSWIAELAPQIGATGPLARARLLEMLAYVSTEVQKNFKPFFTHDASPADRAKAGAIVTKRLEYLAQNLSDDGFDMGSHFTVADAYLFVTLMWARKLVVVVPDSRRHYFDRVGQRGAVANALAHEGSSEVFTGRAPKCSSKRLPETSHDSPRFQFEEVLRPSAA